MIQGVNVPIGLPVPTRSRLPDMLDIKRQNYYMNIAIAVRENANCKGRKVGAVIVRDNRIISTGYNGTPEGFTNCMDGGCVRCGKREEYRREGKRGYAECICVHAEQNALISAARFGNAIEDSVIFSTLRPCFDCTKLMLQAKIRAVYYLHDLGKLDDAELQGQYELLQSKFIEGVYHVDFEDPRADWANAVLPKK